MDFVILEEISSVSDLHVVNKTSRSVHMEGGMTCCAHTAFIQLVNLILQVSAVVTITAR